MGDREKLLAIPALVDSSTKAVTDRIVSATGKVTMNCVFSL